MPMTGKSGGHGSRVPMRPNPRMQRTPSAPLMRKPLGDEKSRRARTILTVSLVGLISAVLLIWPTRHVKACSCLDYPADPVAELKKSGLVFSGEVVAVDTASLPRVYYTEDANHNFIPSQGMVRVGVVTLRTIREWKGDGAKQYVVLAGAPPVTPLPQGHVLVDCQLHLELGKRYLVFATEGYAEAAYCSRTGELEQRLQDVAALDAHAARSKKTDKARR